MSINEAITKAIQESLPAATAGELTKHLQEAKVTAEKLKVAKDELSKSQGEIDKLNIRIKSLQAKDKKYVELNAREKAIIIAENNLKLVISEHKAIEAEKRADAVYKLAETAFKNRSITRMISTQIPVYHSYPGGGGSYSSQAGSERHIETDSENDAI